MSGLRSTQSLGTGCLVVFLLPFAAIGLGVMGAAVRQGLAGDWGGAALMGLFGLVFGLVGIGGIFAVLRAGRIGAARSALQQQHPDAPWQWRTDWAAGRVEDSSRGTMIGAWVFAGFWNLISLPGAYLGLRQVVQQGEKAALLVLLFPAVGLGLLVWALRATVRYRRYGVSRLALAAVPAPVGGALRGTVEVLAVLDAREVLVTLTSVRRVTRGSGKNRSTSETVLWQEEQHVPLARSRTAEGTLTTLPVAFRIPADAEPVDGSNPRDQVLWRLTVAAEVPGVDYHSTFEVPVFRTSGVAADEPVPPSGPASVATFVQPAASRIAVTRNRRGTEIAFRAARNPGAAAGVTLFLAIWIVAVWAMVHFGAPLLLQGIFALFGILRAWVAAAMWFGVSRVTIGDGSVTVARGLFAPLWQRHLSADEIADVSARIGMQAGGRPYYDLVLVRKDGGRVPAGRNIRDKREAEWLADTVREALKG